MPALNFIMLISIYSKLFHTAGDDNRKLCSPEHKAHIYGIMLPLVELHLER